MKTKYCWICGKYISIKEYNEHYDEHYQKGNQRKRKWMIDIPIQKQEKPFNPIKGLDQLKGD